MKFQIFMTSSLFMFSIVSGVRFAVQSVKDDRAVSWPDMFGFLVIVTAFGLACVACYEQHQALKESLLNKPKDKK